MRGRAAPMLARLDRGISRGNRKRDFSDVGGACPSQKPYPCGIAES